MPNTILSFKYLVCREHHLGVLHIQTTLVAAWRCPWKCQSLPGSTTLIPEVPPLAVPPQRVVK